MPFGFGKKKKEKEEAGIENKNTSAFHCSPLHVPEGFGAFLR